MAKGNNHKPILVTGSHRSGSTWVGNVLASDKSLGYMHEPFNPIYPTPKKSPIGIWYLYVSKHNHNTYYRYFKETLKWNYLSAARLFGVNNSYKAKMWLKYNWIFKKSKGTIPLMKDPIALFSAPWLYEQFNMQVVVLVRHPAAFVYSLKRKDWQFPFAHLLEQKELINDWLGEFTAEIENYSNHKKDIIKQGCLIWRIIYATVQKFQQQYPDWSFLKHEDLSLNPEAEFEALFKKLNLEYSTQVQDYVLESSDAENPGGTTGSEEQLQRNSAANVKYWKNKLSPQELAEIKELTQDIWPAFYSEADW